MCRQERVKGGGHPVGVEKPTRREQSGKKAVHAQDIWFVDRDPLGDEVAKEFYCVLHPRCEKGSIGTVSPWLDAEPGGMREVVKRDDWLHIA